MTVTEQQRYLLVKAQKAILNSQHTQTPAQVLVDRSTGKVVEIALENQDLQTKLNDQQVEIIELEQDQVLMPGLLDAHGEFETKIRGKGN